MNLHVKRHVFGQGGGGGGTLIFSYIRRLWPFLEFKGYEDFVDILWGSSQNWSIFRGHFYVF